MASTDSERKAIAETNYNFLLEVLENERVAHPETYEAVARAGEKLRKNYKAFGQIDDMEPIPHLPPKSK